GSPFALLTEGGRHFLVRRDVGGAGSARLEVRPIARPAFYERRTSRGTPMARVATVRGSHLLVHPSTACGFSVRGTPCRFCVDGARYIGRERYLEAVAHAATVCPSGIVWTDLVLGLEPADSTMAGIDALAEMGVVPVAAILRGEHPVPEADEVTPVLAHLYRTVKRRGINMGWVRDLALGITPLEARHFAGDG